MESEYKYPPGTKHAQAIYTDGLGPEFDHNPLIAALQPKWTTAQIGAAMTWWPEYTAKDRERDPEEREELVRRLAYCFETLPAHVQIVKAILNAMRLSLVGRHLLVHGYTEEIHRRAAFLSSRGSGCVVTTSEAATGAVGPPPEVPGQTFLLYGLPGTGKSTLIRRMDVLLPTIIDHVSFRGRDWPCRQVLRLRVIAQRGWTDRALALAALTEFDKATGEHYVERAGRGARASLFSYLIQFTLAAHNHGLGVLFVDEVQLLANNEAILNFILNFNTLVGIPLVLVGTPASVKLMQSDPRFMRRSEGVFDPEFKAFEFPKTTPQEYEAMLKDPDAPRDPWTNFIEAFWHLQYTSRKLALCYNVSKRLHDRCDGLIDYAMKMFVAAQIARIGSDCDMLDEDAFVEVYFSCFKVSLPYLEALRERRTLDLLQYDDFRRQDIDEVVTAAAKLRIKKRREADERMLLELRDAKKRPKRDASGNENTADPVDPSELPEAPADEFK